MVGVLEATRKKFTEILREEGLEKKTIDIAVRGLEVEEAIGDPERDDFPLQQGEEVMIEATFGDSRGQAFTDRPTDYSGSISELLELNLNRPHNRALVVAAVNAVLRELDLIEGTRHCRDEEPEKCGQRMVEWLDENHPEVNKLGIVGYQPAIIEACYKSYGKNLMVSDLNPERVGEQVGEGVRVLNGKTENRQLVEETDFVLATGSTIINGTINELLQLFEEYNRSHAFFGNSIAGPAYLLNLPRLCFYGH